MVRVTNLFWVTRVRVGAVPTCLARVELALVCSQALLGLEVLLALVTVELCNFVTLIGMNEVGSLMPPELGLISESSVAEFT